MDVCSWCAPDFFPLELEGIPYVLGDFLLLCVAKLKIIYSYGGNRGGFVLKIGKKSPPIKQKKNKLEIPIRSLCLSRVKSTLDGTGTCSAGPELLELGLALGFCTGWYWDGSRVPELCGGMSFPQHFTCSHLVKTFSVYFCKNGLKGA